MSSNTTHLPDPIPGTPANEWAQNTANLLTSETANEPLQNTGVQKVHSDPSDTGAVQTTTNTVPHASTDAPGLVRTETVGTPGFPGAYPRGDSYLGSSDPDVGARIIETAQTQLGALAQSAAQYLPQNVKEAVAPYLPAGTSVTASASAHDTTHATSLPTTELLGAGSGEHVGGVGALPGSITETGVADAKAVDDLHSAPPVVGQSIGERVKEAAAPYLPAAVVGTTASALGVSATASEHDKQHATSLPSTELSGAGTREHVHGAGALPGRAGETGVADVESVPQTSGTAPHAQQKTLVERAKETVQPYLPAAVVGAAASATPFQHDTHHITSLPSTELTGAAPGEHIGGVGALPGSVNQSSVALLPEERNQQTTSSTMTGNLLSARDAVDTRAAQSAHTASHETAAGTAGLAGLAGRQPVEKSLPSAEKEGVATREHVSGAGPLPGKVGESGVAVLPHERSTSSTQPSATTASAEPKSAGDASVTKDTHAEHKGLPSRGDGYGADYHPAQLHPATEDYSNVDTGASAQPGGAGQESHPGGTQGRSTNADESKIAPEAKLAASNVDSVKDSSAGPTVDTRAQEPSVGSKDEMRSPSSPGKSKFMDKVKGEFKILAGKMTKNEEKVEEGRALKTGGSPVQ